MLLSHVHSRIRPSKYQDTFKYANIVSVQTYFLKTKGFHCYVHLWGYWVCPSLLPLNSQKGPECVRHSSQGHIHTKVETWKVLRLTRNSVIFIATRSRSFRNELWSTRHIFPWSCCHAHPLLGPFCTKDTCENAPTARRLAHSTRLGNIARTVSLYKPILFS